MRGYRIAGLLALPALIGIAGGAAACGQPSQEWYYDISDVVFDASATCDAEARTCNLLVKGVQKNPENFAIERRRIVVDFQDWLGDWYAENPDKILLICGTPQFETELASFRARFFANVDEETSELVVRRAEIRGADKNLED